MKKICWGLLCLSLIVLLAACASEAPTRSSSSSYIASDSLSHSGLRPSPTPTSIPMPSISSHIATPLPTPTPHISVKSTSTPTPTPTPPPVSNCVTFSNDTTLVPAKNGTLSAPYGPPPVSTEAQQLVQQLFQLVNHDRAACGLPPFAWNATLAAGALLHSWNSVRFLQRAHVLANEAAAQAGRGQAIAPTMDELRQRIQRSIVGAMACPRPAWAAASFARTCARCNNRTHTPIATDA